MSKPTLLSVLLIVALFFSACRSETNSQAKNIKTDIPEPLDESSGDVLSFKRSSGGNLVDAIYFDLVKRTPELQRLEDQFEKYNSDKSDSLQAFSMFKSKVESYYSSANQNLENIRDTVLKGRLKLLLATVKIKYNQKASKFGAVIKEIDSQDIVMKDYHETLKLVATLPIIEKYQDNNIPDIKAVKAIANKAQILKAKTIKMGKKYNNVVTGN